MPPHVLDIAYTLIYRISRASQIRVAHHRIKGFKMNFILSRASQITSAHELFKYKQRHVYATASSLIIKSRTISAEFISITTVLVSNRIEASRKV